jgi:hypothetical protein
MLRSARPREARLDHRPPLVSDSRPRTGTLALLALFIALAVAHTWPLATAPGTLSRNDNGDAILHEWIMAWVAHQVITDPIHLFDANIFYPERHTLAYSDHLFVQSMMAAPLLWSGASPVLAHNLVLIAGFALTGWAGCLLVRRWTGSLLAGILSGSLLAFNAFTLTRLTQIQDLHLEFFPPALFALDRLLAAPMARHGLQLAGWYVAQALTGTYLMVFTAISLVAAFLSRPGDWWGPRFSTFWRPATMAVGVSTAVLVPFLLPYLNASRAVGLGRSLDEVRPLSAEITDYFATGGRVHFESWSRPFFQGDALFPGVAALVLTGVAVGGAVAFRDRRARMALAVGIVAFAFSFGPAFPPYEWLYRVFPLLSGIRGAVRFGQLVLAAVGILAGFGLALVLRRVPPRWSVLVGLGAIVIVNVEALRAPLSYSIYKGIAPVYESLPGLGKEAVLVWIPFPPGQHAQLNAPFMLMTTRSWQRTLNGYSGFKPASYYRHAQVLADFPNQGSLEYLRRVGATHVLVDGRNMPPERLDRLAQFSELSLITTDGNLRIYHLK